MKSFSSFAKQPLEEKLKVSDGLGAWIDDFQKSDAPQFKNADKEKRRDMAIAAFTSAGGKLDENDPCWSTHKQVGMKKKGNKMVPNCVPKEERNISLSFGDFSGLTEAPIDTPDYSGDDVSFAIDVLSKIDDGISTIDGAIEVDNRNGKTNSKKLGLFAIMPGNKRVKWASLARQIIADTPDLEEGPQPPSDRMDKDITIKHKDMDRYIYVNCRPDGKRSKAGDDPNELMTAALCLKSKLTAPKTVEEMDELIEFCKLNLNKVKGASAGQIASLDGQDYVNLCQAVSAALSMHKAGYGKADMVYLTGQAWDNDVKQFQITKYGMKDFNSSDFIVKKGANFCGVSLKKKKRITENDPTLINKSFGTLFQDPKFDKLMKQLDRSAAAFYIKVIREAGRNPKRWKIPPAVANDIKKNITKLNVNNWKKFVTRLPNDLINYKLKGAGSFFEPLYKLILKNSDLLANQLVDLIFKADLKDLKRVNFDFTLVTGIGDYGPRKGVDISDGDYKDINTVTTMLNGLVKTGKNSIRPTKGAVQAFEKEATAAMLKFDLMIGRVAVAHIVLRYKGNFRAAPTFTAEMTDEFKAMFKAK